MKGNFSIRILPNGARVLQPADTAAEAAIARAKLGVEVVADIVIPRNAALFRKFWALVSLLSESLDLTRLGVERAVAVEMTRAERKDFIASAVKIAAGECVSFENAKGRGFVVRSLAKMGGEEFEDFYGRAVAAAARLIRVAPAELRAMLESQIVEF